MRRFLAVCATVTAAFTIALLVVEVALRLTGAGPGRGGVFTATENEFDQVPGIFGPNQVAVVSPMPELTHSVRINNLGYRGDDLTLDKPVGEFRILFVGDSFSFGDFVENDESLPAQTEGLIRARCERPVRVINAGLGGSTITEHRALVERGISVDPDQVILQFSENDVSDLAETPMWDALAENRRAKSRPPLSLIYPLVRGTALWNLALRTAAKLRRRSPPVAPSASDDGLASEARKPTDEYRGVYRDRLDSLQSYLGRRGIPLFMTVLPSHQTVYGYKDTDQLEWLDGLMADLDVDGVSFFPTFQGDGRDETELYLLPYDGHASPEAYRIAAHVLADSLLARGPLSDHCR